MMNKIAISTAVVLTSMALLAFAEAAVVDKTESIIATAVKTEDIDPTSPLLDNFNDGGATNRWGGGTGVFSDAGGGAACSASNDSSAPYEGPFSLKIDYDVETSASYAGYFSNLESRDLSAFTTLYFWVRGSAGGEFFKIELKNNVADANRNHAAVYITDLLDGGVTTGWKQVKIPFHNFANINNWTSMKEFVITFENSQSSINGSPKAGSIYIDNISFIDAAVDIVRIDHFSDKLGTSALGGNMGVMPNELPTTPGAYSLFTNLGTPYTLHLTYDVTRSPSWCGLWMLFGGGSDGWTAVPHDFSGFNYISFKAKAVSVQLNPKIAKLEIEDNNGKRYKTFVVIHQAWLQYKIPLSDFTGLDKTSIKQINFIYEGWRIAAAGGSLAGAMYIDEVQFEK